MRYQLVFQWPNSSITNYDAMIEVENALVEGLSMAAEVDGHDAGSGEVNIFVRTDDPNRTFGEVRAILGSRDYWKAVRVAYREVVGSNYTLLWPPDLTEFRVT